MTFTTLTFILFLALVFLLYWSSRRVRIQNVLLVASSYFFYGWWDFRFCGLMIAASLLDYFAGLILDSTDRPAMRRAALITAISGNLLMLGFFKYFNFFADNLSRLASSIGWKLDVPTLRLVLPVGISFYTFQTMSYTIDIYRRKISATRQIIEYLAYVSFFPQLVAGPIERAERLLPQFFKRRIFDHDKAVDGCRQMLWGFFKKIAIADHLGPAVDAAFANPRSMESGELVAATVLFAAQIYFDFSAYSDIACGTARLFGFELMRNFAYPYFAQNMREFWKRWHISLSTWFKDYVYLPLGGSRVSRVRKAFNVMVTFLLSGFWHGASWNFLLWGALHGSAVMPEMLRARRDPPPPLEVLPLYHQFVRMLIVFAVVCVGWIFFRAKDVSDATFILSQGASVVFRPEQWFVALAYPDRSQTGNFAVVLMALCFGQEWIQRHREHPLVIDELPRLMRWITYLTLAVVIAYSITDGSSQFIYFQF